MQHNNSTSKALIIKMIICVLCVIFKFQVFSPAGLKMQTKLVIFNSIYSGGLPSNGDKAKIRFFYVLRKNIVQTHEITHERDTFNSHVRLHGRDRSAVSRPTTCPWRRKCEFNYLVHAYECVCAILGETIMYKTIIKVVNLMKFR